MPPHRVAAAVVLITALSVSACTGDPGDDPRPDRGAPSAAAESPDAPGTAEDSDGPASQDGGDGQWFGPEMLLGGAGGLAPFAIRPPTSDGGAARTVATIKAGGKGTLENRGYNRPAAAWTEDRVFFLDTADRLTAVDRTTHRVLWRVPRRMPGGDDELCSLTVPSATATTVLVNHGQSLCGEFSAYDQESGRLVAKYRSVSESDRAIGLDSSDYSRNEPLFPLDGRYYWIDEDRQVQRVLDDGTSELAGALDPLLPEGLGPDEPRVTGFGLLPGSDVLALRVQKQDLRFSTWLEDREEGFLIGFRLTGDGVEKVWQHRVRDLARRLPGHNRFSFRFLPEHRGLVSDSTGRRAAGTEELRLWRLDPETGEPGSRPLSFPTAKRRLRADGIPEVLDSLGSEPVVTSRLYLGMISRYGRSADNWLGARDLATGRELWRWEFSTSSAAGGPEMEILGVDPEETHVYVYTNLDFEQWVREIDLATGKLSREWRIPDEPADVRYDLDLSAGYLDGTNLLLVNVLGSRHNVTAGLFEL